MKVILVNNSHRIVGGSDIVVNATIDLLKRRGIAVLSLIRDSKRLKPGFLGKMQAFASGMYSSSACREMKKLIKDSSPDVIQVQEVFPLISPWILQVGRRLRVPVIMRCSNFILTCPTANFFYKDGPCQRCVGGREYWCLLKNCRNNIFESFSYALRTIVARKCRIYQKNVTLFITPSKFVKLQLVDSGIPKGRIVVIPNKVSVPSRSVNPSYGEYVAYAGRVSPEKGVDTLLVASNLTGLPLHVGGDYTAMPDVVEGTPSNIKFLGFLDRRRLDTLYQHARFVVIPSKWYEVSPNSLLEAMSHGIPVIASRIGGITEMVDDCETGLLFEPGNAQDLASKMKFLWDNPDLCRKMGEAGREKAIGEYNEDVYYKRLIAVYEKAIQINKKNQDDKTVW